MFNKKKYWKKEVDEIKREAENYDTLGIKESTRGQLVLLFSAFLIFSFVISLGLKAIGSFYITPTDVLYSLILYVPILYFMYKGHRWAMIVMMVLWTLDRGGTLASAAENGMLKGTMLFIVIAWWYWGIAALYRAIKIENARKKLQQKAVPTMTSVWNQKRAPMPQNMTAGRLNGGSLNTGLGIDKTLRKIIIVGAVIIVPSIVFYFVYLPLKKEYEIKKCSEKATIPLRRTLGDILNEQQAKAQGTQWKAGAGQLDEPVFNKCLVDKGLVR